MGRGRQEDTLLQLALESKQVSTFCYGLKKKKKLTYAAPYLHGNGLGNLYPFMELLLDLSSLVQT